MKGLINILNHFVSQYIISTPGRIIEAEIQIQDARLETKKTSSSSAVLKRLFIFNHLQYLRVQIPALIILAITMNTELKRNPEDWNWSFVCFPICLGIVFQCIVFLQNKVWRIILGLVMFIPVLVLSVLERIAYNFSYDGFNLAFFIHGNLQDIWYYSTPMQKLIIVAILAGVIVLSIWCGYIFAEIPVKRITVRAQLIITVIGMVALFLSGQFPSAPGQLVKFMYSDLTSNVKRYTTTELLTLGIKPWEGTLQASASLKKNLVWIILESTDSSFFDENSFPRLMPNLQKLKKDALVFNNLKMCRNAGFSVGGNFAAMTGECLMISEIRKELSSSVSTIRRIEHDTVMTVSLPGILKKCGYSQEFRESFNPGSDNSHPFSNLGFDYSEVCSNGTAWGISDAEMLELTYQRYLKMPEPFNLVMCTVDTHGDCGRRHKNTTRWYNKDGQYDKYMSVFNYNDKLIGAFIGKLKESPRWKNTIVVFTSDHYLHSGSRTGVSNDNTSKRLTFFVVNCGRTGIINIPGKTFDIAPTLLDLMGVTHNYVFPLGESLIGNPNPIRLSESLTQLDALKFYINSR